MADTDKLAAEMPLISGGDGEFLVEWPGVLHFAIDDDGTVGYAIRDGDKYRAGQFNIRNQPEEAAAEIREALTAAGLGASQATITALEADNKRLREALEPFAAIADLVDGETQGFTDSDEFQLVFHDFLMASWPLTLFRRARDISRNRRETP